MNNSEDLLSICNFLSTQHILTLCASYNADIWCANCFYMFDQQSMALYVMTESTTRHAALMQMNSQVVGTIANQPRNIKLIKGIQYRGDIVMLTGEAEKLARQRYSQRFPVAKVATTPIWQLQLLEIKMTNNALGFAKKLYWMR